jgi:hypothetical protein
MAKYYTSLANRQHDWHELHEHDGRAAFWYVAIPSLILFWVAVAYGIGSFGVTGTVAKKHRSSFATRRSSHAPRRRPERHGHDWSMQ